MALKRRLLSPVGMIGTGIVLAMVAMLVLSLASPRMSTVYTDVVGLSGSEGYSYNGVIMQAGEMAGGAADGRMAQEPQGAVDDVSVQNAQQPLNRVILKSASLRMVVEAADTTLARIAAMAEELGGWVVTSNTSMVTTAAGDQVAQGSITIRVPSDRLDDALSQIKSGAGEIEYETISGQDVTQDYIDLSSRLTNLEAAEEQLRAILDEARRTEDVLAVYAQLVNTRGEIERLRGQIRYYEEAAAYSSIRVELIPQAVEAPVQIAGWSPGRTFENALATLVNVLQFGADMLITLVVLVAPLALIVLVPAALIWRTLRRRMANAAAA